MVKPLEILEKILNLEEKDYQYQDKAVAGGLARYADTWAKQATSAFGEASAAWIEDVTARLRAYSSLQTEMRQEAMAALREVLRTPPTSEPAPVAPVSEPASQPKPPAPIEQPPMPPEPSPVRSQPRETAGRGLEASVTTLAGIGEKRAELLENLNVKTVRDLLFFYPRRYEDYSTLKTINQLVYGERVSLAGDGVGCRSAQDVWTEIHVPRHSFRCDRDIGSDLVQPAVAGRAYQTRHSNPCQW